MRHIMFMVLLPTLIALPAAAASFDCVKAKGADEKAVCANRTLNDLDVKLDTLYHVDTRLVAMGQRGDIQDAQVQWLKRRAICGKIYTCLKGAYQDRLSVLQTTFDGIASRGPF